MANNLCYQRTLPTWSDASDVLRKRLVARYDDQPPAADGLTVKPMTMSVRTFWILLGSVVAFSPMLADDKAYDAAIKQASQAFGAGNLAEADKQVDVAAKIEPASAQTANLRGVIAVQRKEYEDAASRFTEAIAADEKFYPAKLNLADVLLLQRKWADARTRYEELQRIDPKSELLQFKIVVADVLDDRQFQAI